MKTLIGIQDEYTETVLAGAARWAHSKRDGHLRRIRRGAYRKAEKELVKLGFTVEQAERIIGDAQETVKLLQICEEGE